MNATSQQQISSIITLNRQTGETYVLKMAGDPSILMGIPVPATDDPEKFIINLSNPTPGRLGTLFEGRIQDIQYIEKA